MKSRLPALEKNILKYRALEMTMVLFHTESLKNFVVGSISATDNLYGRDRLKVAKENPHKRAWEILVTDGVITRAESDDIQKLIDYRNDIGHRVHLLVCDLSRKRSLRGHFGSFKKDYDYEALDRLKALRTKIEEGLRSKYVMQLSLSHDLFEDAERVFMDEIVSLRCKIDRQFRVRKMQVEQAASARR
jgi:hypothetical protein